MEKILYKMYELFKSIGDSLYQSLIYDNRYKYILEGLTNTIIISIFAVIIGIIIGILVALIRNNYERNGKMKIANFIAKTYVSVIRGTPVILQLMIIYSSYTSKFLSICSTNSSLSNCFPIRLYIYIITTSF